MNSLFSSDFHRRCQGLARLAARVWGGDFLGRKAPTALAGGTEITGQSDYTTGDDYRYVDWNRCARLDELVTHQFRGSEIRRVSILVDVSGSMRIGGKLEAAKILSAALGFLALAQYHRTSIGTFSNRLMTESREGKGLRHFPAIERFLQEAEEDAEPTKLSAVASDLARSTRPRGLVVLISDLLDAGGIEKAVDTLRRFQFEPVLWQLIDAADASPQNAGKFRLRDAETGAPFSAHWSAQDLARYRELFGDYCRALRFYCRRRSIGYFQTDASLSFDQALVQVMRSSRALAAATVMAEGR